jgi:hypothetical protein
MAEFFEGRISKSVVLSERWIDILEFNELLGIAHRKHFQQNRVNQTENGGVGTDAECKRCDHDKGESPALPERSPGITNVLPHTFEERNAVYAVDLLANEGGISKFAARGLARLVGTHAAGEVFVCFDFEISV